MGKLNRPLMRVVKPNTVPVAGAGFVFRPNKDGGWLFRGMRFLFTTDANVATRQVMLQASDGTDIYMQLSANNSQTAGRADVYSWFPGATGSALIAGMLTINSPADGLYLPRGHTLTAVISNIQA